MTGERTEDTREKFKVITTVGIVVVEAGRVLLVKHLADNPHFQDVYGLPYGIVDEKESEIETLLRKVQSETGLSLSGEDASEFPENNFQAEIVTKEGPKNFSLK